MTNLGVESYPVIADEDYLYFRAKTADQNFNLYRYDAISKKITRLTSIFNGAGYSAAAGGAVILNRNVYFVSWIKNGDSVAGKLYKYDPMQNSSIQITDICGNENDAPLYLTVYRDSVYFVGISDCFDSNSRALYRYNPVDNNLTKLTNSTVWPYYSSSSPTQALLVYNDELYFNGNIMYDGPGNPWSVSKLLKYNGEYISQASAVGNLGHGDRVSGATVIGDTMYFFATPVTNGLNLFKFEAPPIP